MLRRRRSLFASVAFAALAAPLAVRLGRARRRRPRTRASPQPLPGSAERILPPARPPQLATQPLVTLHRRPPHRPQPHPSAAAPAAASPLRSINPGRDAARPRGTRGRAARPPARAAGGARRLQRGLVGPGASGHRAPRLLPHAGGALSQLLLGRHNSSVPPSGDQQYLWPHPARPDLLDAHGHRRADGAVCGSDRATATATTRPSRARTCASG